MRLAFGMAPKVSHRIEGQLTMTRYNPPTAAAGVLLVLLAGGALAATASAHLDARFRCLLAHPPSNPHHVITLCDARTPEALARLRAAKCDPAMTSDAAMRAQCLAMMMSEHRTYDPKSGSVG